MKKLFFEITVLQFTKVKVKLVEEVGNGKRKSLYFSQHKEMGLTGL